MVDVVAIMHEKINFSDLDLKPQARTFFHGFSGRYIIQNIVPPIIGVMAGILAHRYLPVKIQWGDQNLKFLKEKLPEFLTQQADKFGPPLMVFAVVEKMTDFYVQKYYAQKDMQQVEVDKSEYEEKINRVSAELYERMESMEIHQNRLVDVVFSLKKDVDALKMKQNDLNLKKKNL